MGAIIIAAPTQTARETPSMPDEVSMSRREFFDYIWSAPLSEMKRDYGLTELRMAKICLDHRLPCPPPGYWMRRPAGVEKPSRPLLPRVDGVRPVTLVKTRRFGFPLGRRAPKAQKPIVSEAAHVLVPIAIPDTLPLTPHHITDKIIAQMEAIEPRAGIPLKLSEPPVTLNVSETLIDRSLVFLDTLLRSLEGTGHRIQDGEAIVDGERVAFDLFETEKIVPHVVSKDEAHLSRVHHILYKEMPKTVRPPPAPPEWDFMRSGLLALDIKSFHFDRPNAVAGGRQWSEERGRPLEGQLPEIVHGVSKVAEAASAHRLAVEKAKREREEMERQRRLEEIDRELRVARRAHLREGAAAIQEAMRLEEFLRHIASIGGDGAELEAICNDLSEMIAEIRANWGAEALRLRLSAMNADADRRRSWITKYDN